MTERKAYYENDGDIHELLDRLWVAQDQLDRALRKHNLVQAVPDFENEIQMAITILAELYQTVGQYTSIDELKQHHELVH